ESQLTQLGYTLDYDDLPDFDYPIDADNGDPMGFIAFFKTVPALPLNVDEVKSAQKKLNGFKVALRKKLEEAAALMLAENKKQKQLSEKMVSDGAVGKKILELLNSPPHKLAIAKALKSKVKKEAGQTPQKTEMLEPAEIFDRCAARYEVEVLTPRQQHLDAAMQKLEEIEKRYKPCAAAEANPCGNGWQVKMCAEANAVKNTFLKKDEELKKLGESIFTETFFKYKKELIEELKVKYYQEYNTALLQQQVSGGIHRRIIERKSSFYANYYSFLTRFNNYYNKIKIEFSKCETRFAPIYYTEEVDDQLVSLTDFKEPKCTFSKEIDNGVTKIKMICNELLKESDKIQEKQSNVSKGAGLSGSPGIQQGNNGPVAPGRGGPATHFQEINEPDWSRGPLKAEVKDLSQYSIEFDRWGNMTGLKFQLNKEGTGLADPDSKESGVDSRWSWNAAGSANKGFLNRLLIK
ncbi:MAG: hypothetical protein ACXWWC_16055, partial [Chitinophagaceae bacterium]